MSMQASNGVLDCDGSGQIGTSNDTINFTRRRCLGPSIGYVWMESSRTHSFHIAIRVN